MRTTITNRMMIGASLLGMTFSLCLTDANAQTCAKVPTCAELGYTETNCGSNVALKCPFDQTKLFCGKEKCKAGDIYYSDNTCSDEYNSSKTVIGVVAGEGFIVNIEETGESMKWEPAINACKGVSRGGKTARLPTIDEGLKIANSSGAINRGLAKISGATQLKNDIYWSSTELENYTSNAWYFYPIRGTAGSGLKAGGNFYVRCVFAF